MRVNRAFEAKYGEKCSEIKKKGGRKEGSEKKSDLKTGKKNGRRVLRALLAPAFLSGLAMSQS